MNRDDVILEGSCRKEFLLTVLAHIGALLQMLPNVVAEKQFRPERLLGADVARKFSSLRMSHHLMSQETALVLEAELALVAVEDPVRVADVGFTPVADVEPRVSLSVDAQRRRGGEGFLAGGTLEVLHGQMAPTVVLEMCDRFETEAAGQTLELFLVVGVTRFQVLFQAGFVRQSPSADRARDVLLEMTHVDVPVEYVQKRETQITVRTLQAVAVRGPMKAEPIRGVGAE